MQVHDSKLLTSIHGKLQVPFTINYSNYSVYSSLQAGCNLEINITVEIKLKKIQLRYRFAV